MVMKTSHILHMSIYNIYVRYIMACQFDVIVIIIGLFFVFFAKKDILIMLPHLFVFIFYTRCPN